MRIKLLLLLAITFSFMGTANALQNGTRSTTVGSKVSAGTGTTYYVRVNGGTSTQCTGLVNADYSGSGTAQPCAFSNPSFAIGASSRAAKMVGGDILIIQNGTYQIGYGAPGFDTGCSTSYAYSCKLLPVPSGTAAKPTRILGEGYGTGCSTRPKLSGRERANSVFSIENSGYVEIQCLEITDGAECGGGKANTPYDYYDAASGCNRNTYPHGNYALNGIAGEASHDIYMKNVNVHGLAGSGVTSARISNWSLVNVDMSYNSSAGWNGDIGGTDNTGYIKWVGGTVNWNGCIESATTKGVILPGSCVGQGGGNYADGIGMNNTGGDWYFKNVEVSYNVQDGIDLLYLLNTGTVTYENILAIGNGGNALKTGNTRSMNYINNSTLIGNCTAMGPTRPYVFAGSNTFCRAGGHPVAAAGDTTVNKSTIYTSGTGVFLTTDRNSNYANLIVNDSVIYMGNEADVGGQNDLVINREAAIGWNQGTNPSTWTFNNTLISNGASRNYIPTDATYVINGVTTAITNVCQLSSIPSLGINGCVDPQFNELPVPSLDGPDNWFDIPSLTLKNSSPIKGTTIGDSK